MAKKVLFQPEDFDKPQKKNKKKLLWGTCICAVLALVGIGGYAVLAPKALETPPEVEESYISDENINADKVPLTNSSSFEDSTLNIEKNFSEQGINEHNVEDNANQVVKQSESLGDNEFLEREAMKVIRGDYGDGKVRKNQLGERYSLIQERVNQLKSKGAF